MLFEPRSYSQVGNTEVVTLDERPLLLDDLVKTNVRVEAGLNLREDCNGSVGTTAAMFPSVMSNLLRIRKRKLSTYPKMP